MRNFQEFNKETGMYSGYSYDYMLAIAQYAHWKYEFVPVSYDEGIRMLESEKIDLMNNVQKTDVLASHLSFSTLPSGESCTCLTVSPENITVSYEDFKAFGNLTVGLDYLSSMNSGFVDYCKDNDCMPHLIYYHTTANVIQGMEKKEINAYLVNSLQNTNMRTIAKFDTRSYYFATAKANTDILQELNTAMTSLKTNDPYFTDTIYEKYHSRLSKQQTVVSDSEKTFIAECPVVTVAYDPYWHPLSYTEKGRFKGALADMLSLISTKTGLHFQYVAEPDQRELQKSIINGKTQIIAGFPYDYTWADKFNVRITTPITKLTMFSAYKTDVESGMRIAIPKDSYQEYLCSQIRQDPSFLTEYPTVEKCLNAILRGTVNDTFLDSYQLEYYRKRVKYRKLSFKVINGNTYSLAIAVSNAADDRLYSILSKSILSLNSDEISSILRNATSAASPHSLPDLLYANTRIAGPFFALAGFLTALLIIGGIYTKRIKRKNAELKVATNAKSVFLSNISHDMRTPLNGIIGYTQLAMQSDDPYVKADYLKKIQISGRLLLDLINDTLDISKIESGKYTLVPEIVNTADLLEGIIIPIKQTAESKKIQFNVDISKMKTGQIKVDRLNLQKIILNLLSNAVKFTAEGGTIGLTIRTLDPLENGMNTQITVRDTGIGIGKDFQSKLFQPFMQERAPEARGITGTGLGLSIVRTVVEMMGGHIDMVSKKGNGTQFDVFLPLEYTKTDICENKPVVSDHSLLKGYSVLLCEDNYMNKEISMAVLESFGMKVTCASNGQEGLTIFKASPENGFNIILMDLRMPIMDGYEATAAIRQLTRKDALSVPIIAMSADAYDEDIQKCNAAGMNGHISKPFDSDTLFNTLLENCCKSGEKK